MMCGVTGISIEAERSKPSPVARPAYDSAYQSLIPLPVQSQDRERVDEKYSYRNGYSDLDRAFGTDWGNEDE